MIQESDVCYTQHGCMAFKIDVSLTKLIYTIFQFVSFNKTLMSSRLSFVHKKPHRKPCTIKVTRGLVQK